MPHEKRRAQGKKPSAKDQQLFKFLTTSSIF